MGQKDQKVLTQTYSARPSAPARLSLSRMQIPKFRKPKKQTLEISPDLGVVLGPEDSGAALDLLVASVEVTHLDLVSAATSPLEGANLVSAPAAEVASGDPTLPPPPAPIAHPSTTTQGGQPAQSVQVLPSFDLENYSPQLPLSTQDMLRPNDQLRQSIEAFLLDQRSPHTRRAYGKDLKRFVQFLHSRNHQLGIEKLSRVVLISYKEFLISEGLEHTTIDRHLATLRSFFKWLVDDGYLQKSPAEGVRFLNPKRISRTIGFADEEVKKLLTFPNLHSRSGALHYAILMVLFYCGLRRSELCDLRTANFGTERGQRVIRLRGKGNAERMIVLVPAVWNAIEYYFYISNRSLDENNFVFLPIRNNRTGVLNKSLDTSMIFYIVTRYARLAGIANRVSPHSCRATAISNARDHHVPDRAIQEFAGWASPDMITRYDKRRSAIEDSAAHSINYGNDSRNVPKAPVSPPEETPPAPTQTVEI